MGNSLLLVTFRRPVSLSKNRPKNNESIEDPLTCFYTGEKSWGSLQGRQNLDLLASGEIDKQRVHTL